ncbi:hypothetical protein, partial [Chromatium okenii]|uniref:hypothetical protein n=1 Tax=Chromatium okenii TaxID=61644 RepID=UPI0026EA1244
KIVGSCVAEYNHTVPDTYGQIDVPDMNLPSQLVSGADHSCALDGRTLVCWGRNDQGQTNVPTGLVFGAGVRVTPLDGFVTSEAGQAAKLSISLETCPTADVSVLFASSDLSEGQPKPQTLIFTLSNWDQPQTITVKGIDDTVADGDIRYKITVTTASADVDYQGTATVPIELINQDNDSSLNPIGTPTVHEPQDGAEIASKTPILAVENAFHTPTQIASYDFELFSDLSMTEPVSSALGIIEGSVNTSWQVDVALEENHWYWWRVRTNDGLTYSEWVNTRFFVNTVNDIPDIFHLSAPADNAEIDSLQPILSVTNSTDPDGDALTYGFEVFKSNNLITPILSVTDLPEGDKGSTNWQVSANLAENLWYEWFATVTDEHGIKRQSEERNRFFVNTENSAPQTPSVDLPKENATVAQKNIVLRVNNAVDPDDETLQYLFEIDSVVTFDSANLIVSVPIVQGLLGSTDWSVSGLLENSRYYWRVRATDGRAQSPWVTASFRVNIANDPPSVPTGHNPGDGAWVESLRPTLSVNPAIDPEGDTVTYNYQIYDSENVLVSSTDNVGETWTPNTNLKDNRWYYWQAQAKDPQGLTSQWMTQIAFFVDSNGVDDPPKFTFTAPLTDITQATGTIHIAWTDSDPDSNALIDLYYENASDSGLIGSIAKNIPEDSDGKADELEWNISTLTPGIYRIYAVIKDDTTTVQKDASAHLNVTNNRASIKVTRTSQADTTEAGLTATFEVVLDRKPISIVTIPLASNDSTEGVSNSNQLVFTSANWSKPQTVTITGVGDCAPDGDQTYQIQIGSVISDDPAYNGINPEDLSFTNLDDDPPSTHPTISVCGYELVGESRVNRYEYDLVYRVHLTNNAAIKTTVLGTVTTTSSSSRIIDGSINFGTVAAGATVLSPADDTFTIRQDRRYSFAPTTLRWEFVTPH